MKRKVMNDDDDDEISSVNLWDYVKSEKNTISLVKQHYHRRAVYRSLFARMLITTNVGLLIFMVMATTNDLLLLLVDIKRMIFEILITLVYNEYFPCLSTEIEPLFRRITNKKMLILDSGKLYYARHDKMNGEVKLDNFHPTTIKHLSTLPPILSLATTMSTWDDEYHGIVNTTKGLYSFGCNAYGKLGLGHCEDVDIEGVQKIPLTVGPALQVACGTHHTMFIGIKTTKLYACGDNSSGQLGLERIGLPYKTFTDTKVDNVISVSCGRKSTIILKRDGSIYSCGDNRYGELGWGNPLKNTSTNIFTRISLDSSGQPLLPIKGIRCNNHSTIAYHSPTTFYTFGVNYLANEPEEDDTGWVQNFFTRPLKVNSDNKIKHFACGNEHTVLLTERSELYGNGRNDYRAMYEPNNCTKVNWSLQMERIDMNLDPLNDGKIQLVTCDDRATYVYTTKKVIMYGHVYIGNNKY